MWIEPIFDRTRVDVDLIRLDPKNSNNKGAFNYTDLNRIESNCEYIVEARKKFPELYKKVTIVTKTNWNATDIPTLTDLNRIRNNIIALIEDIENSDIEEIELANTMDYIKANILEKDLAIVKEIIEVWKRKQPICGTFYCKSA